MYAIVKTGGKQYKVAVGDKINIEKLDAAIGEEVELQAICIVDGEAVEANPEEAAKTKVVAEVLEQFKGEKQIVFKFKRRKNYKKLRGHRQQLTRVQIKAIGADVMQAPVAAEEPAEEAAAPEMTQESLMKLTVPELKAIAAEKEIKVTDMKKAEIVEALLGAE